MWCLELTELRCWLSVVTRLGILVNAVIKLKMKFGRGGSGCLYSRVNGTNRANIILFSIFFFPFLPGVLEKTCFYSNGSEVLTVNGDIETSDILLPNMVENSSTTNPTVDLSTWTPAWTTTPLSHIGQMNKNSNVFRETFQENSFVPTSQDSVLNPDPTNDAALTEGSEYSTQLFATAEGETSWSINASFNITERMTTLPVLRPTHPSVPQKVDQKKSKFIFYLVS